MERISGVVKVFNEAHNIKDCLASMEGVDEIIVSDDGSTDNTVALAKEMGAKVFRRKPFFEVTTKAQVKAFRDRFSWSPSFKSGDRIYDGSKIGQEAVDKASFDWILCPDADERVTWNSEYIKNVVMPNSDQITCEFVHSHKPNGKPDRVMSICKTFRRSVTKFGGRTHTCILPAGREVSTKRMRIDHWQPPGHVQVGVMPILEYSVIVDDDQRSKFYLGREYYYAKEWDRALTLLGLYLDNATWLPEINQALLYMGQCYWYSGRGDLAREYGTKVVLNNPDHGEALYFMAAIFDEPWRSKWLTAAKHATNEGVLF